MTKYSHGRLLPSLPIEWDEQADLKTPQIGKQEAEDEEHGLITH